MAQNLVQALKAGLLLADPTVVLFMRHGQCRSNTEGLWSGYSDERDVLTPTGICQSKQAAAWLRDTFPTRNWRVHTSTLTRAVETGQIVNQVLQGVLMEPDSRITEYPGERVESLTSLADRLRAFRDERSQDDFKGNTGTLVVTHGFVLEFMLASGLGLERPTVVHKSDLHAGTRGLTTHANGGISAFGGPALCDLVMWNSHAHLITSDLSEAV